jgi:DNA (cytosine-5)-methyltransferase 1
MFSGLGGSSTAATMAIRARGEEIDLRAINHWNLSCASHFVNHRRAAHFCEKITRDRAREIVPEGYLDLLIASPECTNHSLAKNGQPRDDQSRATPMLIADWCSRVFIERLFIENVPEMRMWGPLDRNGDPIKELAGTLYVAWMDLLRALGYSLSEQIVDAADYGDAQHRERLFIMGQRSSRAPAFPMFTHGDAGLFNLQAYRTARDIIDWSNIGRPVESKRRLCPRTMDRIVEGYDTFKGEPFLLPRVRHGNSTVRSVDRPLHTVTCTSWDIGLVTPRKGRFFHRCVTTKELMASMSFPGGYQVLSPEEAQPTLREMGLPLDCRIPSLPSVGAPGEFRTVQVGNAVCVKAVAACIGSLLSNCAAVNESNALTSLLRT